MRKLKDEKKCIFEEINKGELIFLTLFTFLICALYQIGQYNLLSYLSLIIIVFFCFYRSHMSLGVYIISNLYISQILSTRIQIGVLVLILGLMILKCKNNRFNRNDIFALAFFTTIISVSSLVGISINISIAILMFLDIVAYIVIHRYCSKCNISSIIFSYFICAIGLNITVLINYFTGDINSLIYGRLNFEGDIKTLAILSAIPLSFILTTRMENKKIFNIKINKLLVSLVAVLYATTIFLTAARGVILALIIGIIIQYLISKNKGRSIKFLLILCIVILILYSVSIDSTNFRIERVFDFDEYASANGRTQIWAHYISTIYGEGILNIFFGIGPGDVARISESGNYAHSTFLDFFFSYGLFGFVSICWFEIFNLKKIYASKERYLLSITAILIVIYLGHGTAANTTLFIIQSLIMCIAERSNEKECVEKK